MRIKTYEAPTEQEALELAKQELGSSAIILTIKKITPKGIFKLFRKQKVEITAALDEVIKKPDTPPPESKEAMDAKEPAPAEKKLQPLASSESMLKDVKISEQEVKIKTLEQMLTNSEELLKNLVAQLALSQNSADSSKSVREAKFENAMLQVFYDTLIGNGVTEEIATELLSDLDTYFDDADTNINILVKLLYNRIIQKLGEPEPISLDGDGPKKFVFMGPTGVGKTTTIAKLASRLIIKDKKKVGLITADTYRIAAVEQLRVYGDILGIDVEVVYNSEDLLNSINKISAYNDVIFIDTAGRSHKNQENINDLKELLKASPNTELFLVLSSTTKYEDLREIANVYGTVGDYTIILTKIDETGNLGLALNLCSETGKCLSYLTDGQNVPDDIKIAEPSKIAKVLLGSMGD